MNTTITNKHKGFTLIELMIVIAIVGILMLYAIPAYSDYLIRSKAGECISMSNGAKVGVSERWSALNSLAAITDNTTALVAPAASITGANVLSVQVSANGVITCTFNNNDSELSGSTIVLTPNEAGGSLEWACTTTIVKPAHQPGNC
jgi:type IV pilus assembly protein PilA